MGHWGTKAWENDEAGDWFNELFRESCIREVVRRALECDVKQDFAVVRAAAFMLIQLGNAYIWPVEYLEDDLRLAVTQLESARDFIASQQPDSDLEAYIELLDHEISALLVRIEEQQPDNRH